MNAQQLRNSILQEAIEGRLVPQDPNDEPASVLLERIREEKRRLVKEGKLKKKDLEETPISEDEKPFEIPNSWEWCRIGSIFNHASGKQQSSNNKKVGTLKKYITTSNLYWDRFELDVLKEMYFTDEELKTCTAQKGDLLVCEGGAGYGRSAIWSFDYDICLQNHVHRLRPYVIGICKYVYYIIYLLKESNRLASVGTAMPGLSANRLKEIMVPLPPLAEQHRIVAKIEEVLPKVEEYGKAQDELNKLNEELPERLKKSILQEAIEGRLVPQDPNDEPASVLLDKIRKEKEQLVKEGKLKKKDLEEKPISEDEKPFEIPESWKWVRISDVVNVLMGQSPDGNDVFEAKEGDKAYEFHQGKICFTEKYITPSGKWCKIPSRIANKDSLLICVRAPIGDVNITQRSIGIGRGLAAMEGMGNISNIFLFYWMLAHKRCLEDQGTGSTFKAITVEVLKNQKIPLPPLAEQKRIVAKIEELFAEIDKLKA